MSDTNTRCGRRVTHSDITLERGGFPMGGWVATWWADDRDGFGEYLQTARLIGYTKTEARRVAHARANGEDY